MISTKRGRDLGTINGQHFSALVDYVLTMNHVTFVGLERLLKTRGVDTVGEERVEIANKNVIYWQNMSELFVEFVLALQMHGQIEVRPCERFAYYLDGGTLPLPLARVCTAGYESLHWLPVRFCRVVCP